MEKVQGSTNSSRQTLQKPALSFRSFLPVIKFSLVVNMLYLTGPIFMMQVYDRVLASANVPTLVALLGVVGILYIFFGLLEFVKSQSLIARGEAFSEHLSDKAYMVSMLGLTSDQREQSKVDALDSVATLRSFLVSPAFSAIFDLPWSPIFLIFVFGLHPGLGVIAIVATLLLAAVAVLNERFSRQAIKNANAVEHEARLSVALAQRNVTTLRANGMLEDMSDAWRKVNHRARQEKVKAASVNSSFSTLTKTLRLAIQSLMLGAGAYFVIKGEMTAGGIIAGSITFARALAPLEQLLMNFSMLVSARDSWRDIQSWQALDVEDDTKNVLPAPKNSLEVVGLFVKPPNSEVVVLKGVSFNAEAGDIIAVSGPSGSGKSTMAKALAAACTIAGGKICLDGVELSQWPRGTLGRYMGYLPQEIELFDGTIAENIARFRPQSNFEEVLKASKLAGTHELIIGLPEGYDTRLGANGVLLSAGQRQRIALARAVYGDPFLIILDEPNSNLDRDGDAAIMRTLKFLRERGAIVVMVVHRPDTLKMATKLCVLSEGKIQAFGSPASILNLARKHQNNITAA